MRAHLDQELTLEQLAAVAGLSAGHFLRAFKRATGQTPHRYLVERRLEQAQRLLAATADPIADIAYACGFSSQSHMTDRFTRELGIAPARYRRQQRDGG
jgi:AraC family transcriptional regulator